MNTVEPYAFIITFLLGGVILIGLFVIAIIFKSRDLGISRYLLAIALLGLTQHLITYLLFTTQLIREWPHLFGVGYPLLFLVGPCFYLFICSYGNQAFRIRSKHLLHLLPFVAISVLYLPLFFGTLERKIAIIDFYYEILPEGPVSFNFWFQASVHLLIILAYAVIAWIHLHRSDRQNTVLLKRITLLLILLVISEIFVQTGFLLTGVSAITTEIVLAGLMSITLLMLGFWIVDMKQIVPLLQTKKYKTSPLSPSKAVEIKREIQHFLEQEEPYLNPNLKIADLSEALGIPAHHISQVLGEELNTNFYDIINRYRITRAQELLQSDLLSRISIQAIGQECGFSSKTSFYRAFKKVTNMTPTQFIEWDKRAR